MKASDIREQSMEEKLRKVDELTEELFNLRFQHATDQLENSQKLKLTKRDIARVKTIIKEERLKQETENQQKGE